MLDKLIAAAGLDDHGSPLEVGGVVATGTSSGGSSVLESIREFLDQQRSGWGAKFAAVFEERYEELSSA